MENAKVARRARAQQAQACCPAVITHWQPGSILETKFTARIIEDNRVIINGFQALAENPGLTAKEMMRIMGGTYFRTPRLLTKSGWVEGWEKVLPLFKEIIVRDSRPAIDTVSVVIEYQPFAGAKTPADDIDAVAKIQFSFSASPGGTTAAGELKHSRVCEII